MADNNRITVLLGAGAMMEATALSTKSLTEKVISKQQEIFYNGEMHTFPLLKDIYNQLRMYYAKEDTSVSFEDVFHTLEMLDSLQTAQKEQTVKSFRSVFGMLCDIKESVAKIEPLLLYTGMNDLITTVIKYIASFEKSWQNHSWFVQFFKELKSIAQLDIFSLNYDTWLEQILENYNDGFIPLCEGYQKFSANHLFQKDDSSTINHLHGQICFTSHLPQELRKLEHSGVYKATDFDIINNLKVYPKYGSTMCTTQSAEQIYQYPIITGLRKTDKILMPPFDAYLTHLYQQLMQNNCLLVVGYGFGDVYINSLLNQYRSFHGSDCKVIYISHLPEEKWIHNMYELPISIQFKQTIYKTFQDSDLAHRFLGFKRLDFLESQDKTSRVYFCGFSGAVTHYSPDIINFYHPKG